MADFNIRADVKTLLNITSTGDDAHIDLLIPQVTAQIESMLGRPYFLNGGDVTEYPRVRASQSHRLFLLRWPIEGVKPTSVHVSLDVPRVYDATTLLVKGEEYMIDPEEGVLVRIGAFWPQAINAIQVIYDGGITDQTTASKDLVRAGTIMIAAMLQKGKDRLYHATQERLGDAELRGVRFDDVPQTAREIIRAHREVAR
ncbi:MAG: hypothetical protein V3S82_10385 [Dehalococcoidia bacterium]